jgi:hypothetical protein
MNLGGTGMIGIKFAKRGRATDNTFDPLARFTPDMKNFFWVSWTTSANTGL